MRTLATAVSEILRGVAAKQGVAAGELASRTGHRREKINRLFAGRTVMSMDDADMICGALGIELDQIIREAIAETPDRPRKLSTSDELLRSI
jgi:ribosome-binding protein aMBF1 (putative translation factor)